jgi:putative hemolysin
MEQEFRQMVDLSKEEGLLVEEERELIHNVFEFTDKVVKDIMTPITRCFMLPIDMPYTKMLEEIKATEFRRIPIYEQDQNSIIGVLHVRDLLPFHQKKSTVTEKDIRELLHSPIFVNELEPIEKLLRKIQSHRVHLAIVADRERKVLGMVTLHDVLEELFGEIESD